MYSWTKMKLDGVSIKFFYFFMIFRKKKILENYKKGVKDLKDKIDVVKSIASYSKKKNWNDIYRIWNIAGFILMTSLDIKIINELLIKSKGFGRNEFAIKSACILIFEVLEDLEQILGKDFYLCLDNLLISKDLIDDLNLKKKDLSNLKSIHHKDLKKVRSIIGAHRDHDFLNQLEIFDGLETTSIHNLMLDFEKKLNSLADPLQQIINKSAENFINKNKK